jgi:large repetitive protein
MDLISVGDAEHGFVFLNDNGTPNDASDDFVEYTPFGTFTTVDQFEYRIGNANGSGPESVGLVTIFNENVQDQGLQINMQAVDMDGDPIFEIVVGEQFQLVVTIQDARQVVPQDEWGVFSAYLDVLYDRDLVSTVRSSGNRFGYDITFGDFYTNGRKSNADLPGVLDETGAFQAFVNPDTGDVITGGLGPDVFEFFRVTFVADAVGTVDFLGNPANDPVNNVLYFDPDDSLVPIDDIFYGFTSLDIVTPEQGEGSPLDVNRDGYVSPWDALLVINHLNRYGVHGMGEGESRGYRSNYRLDVNRDLLISPLDALLVINWLNNAFRGGEGEAEGEPGGWRAVPSTDQPAAGWSSRSSEGDELLPAGLASPDPLAIAGGGTQDTPSANLSRPGMPGPDQALSQTDDWRLAVGESNDRQPTSSPPEASDDSEWESLLQDLAEGVLDGGVDAWR